MLLGIDRVAMIISTIPGTLVFLVALTVFDPHHRLHSAPPIPTGKLHCNGPGSSGSTAFVSLTGGAVLGLILRHTLTIPMLESGWSCWLPR